MGSLAKSAQDLWNHHRGPSMIALALLAVALAVVGYLLLKRPGDVSTPDAPFAPAGAKESTAVVDWPTYGQNGERQRYLPAKAVKPPFKGAWKFKGQALLEYSPILVAGTLYGINNNGLAFAVDARTGKARWK